MSGGGFRDGIYRTRQTVVVQYCTEYHLTAVKLRLPDIARRELMSVNNSMVEFSKCAVLTIRWQRS